MALIKVNWHPGDKELRDFGLIGLIAALILSLLLYFIKKIALKWILVIIGIGVVIFIVSRLSLKATKLIYLALVGLTLPIGLVVSFILMSLFFFLLVTPLSLFFRIIGRDPLRRKFEPDAQTYWLPHRPPKSLERYFQQF